MAKEALRLRAARLAAGYVVGKDAALGLGIPLQTYRTAESGAAPLGKALVKALVSRWGISEAFLHEGKPETRADNLALRISLVLEEAETSKRISSADYATRLREMRAESGYGSPGAAAKAKGWGGPIYTSHEANQNPITVERQIAYALAYGFRPEYAVLGRTPKRPEDPSDEESNWKDLRASGDVVSAPSVDAWQWLRSPEAGIPVIVLQMQKLRLAPQRLSIPLPQLLNLSTKVGERGFYAFQPSNDDTSFFLVDPLGAKGRLVTCNESGSAAIKAEDGLDVAPTNPLLAGRIGEPIILGRLLAKIVVKMELK